MGIKTQIEWCDSTVNPTMGCGGCELWNREAGVAHCYAGTLTDRYGGRNSGFPTSFDVPELFPGRIEQAARWSDLTGSERPDKPWLNGNPRMIFVGDMGDTFSESLGDPVKYLAPLVEIMAKSPHQWLMLTKRPSRMAKFSRDIGGLPENVWPGTTVTSQKTVKRVAHLLGVSGGGPKWLSAEPLLGPIDLGSVPTGNGWTVDALAGWWSTDIQSGPDSFELGQQEQGPGLDWIIGGAESGAGARVCHPDWARSLRDSCSAAGVPFLWKQWGTWIPYEQGPAPLWDGQDGFSIDRHTLPEGLTEHEEVNGWYWPCDPEHLDVIYRRSTKGKSGRLLDGVEHVGVPKVGAKV